MARHIDVYKWLDWLREQRRVPIHCETYQQFGHELQCWDSSTGINLMLVARGALGKSYYCRHSLPHAYMCDSKLTPWKLYLLLWKNPDMSFIIDDYDQLCENRDMKRLLRTVLNTDDERIIHWDTARTGKEEGVPSSIKIRSKFAIILNDPPINDGSETFKAYISRFRHIVFTPSNAEIFRYAKDVCKFSAETCSLLMPLVNSVYKMDLRMFKDAEKGKHGHDKETWRKTYAPEIEKVVERPVAQLEQMVRDSQTMFDCTKARVEYCGISRPYYYNILNRLNKEKRLGSPIVPCIPPKPEIPKLEIPKPKSYIDRGPQDYTSRMNRRIILKRRNKDAYDKRCLRKHEEWLAIQVELGNKHYPELVESRMRKTSCTRLEALKFIKRLLAPKKFGLLG